MQLAPKFAGIFISIALFYSCSVKNKGDDSKNSKSDTSLFSLISVEKSGLDFTNTLDETPTQNIYAYQYFYNGAGVAIGDINNDSLPDVFFASNQGSCQLYLNKGALKFENITTPAKVNTTGWCTGVTMADVNGDGWLDIYVCRSQSPVPENRANLLFINNQNGTFKEEAARYHINDFGYASQAYFFDYDRDNDLDLFICNHPYTWDNKIEKQAIQNATNDPYATDRLYRNDGSDFTDVSKAAGVHSFAFSLSAAIADYNNDGLPDIYVCNDYTMNDFLYINNGNGTFSDKIFDYFPHTSFYSMGSDMGDINNDGLIDLVTLDMLPEDNSRQRLNMMRVDYDRYMAGVKWGFGYAYMHNMLQLNTGNKRFSEIGQLAGIEATDWSWAPLLQDFDNDGWLDLYITNGYKRDFTNADFIVYENERARGQTGHVNDIMDLLNNMPSVKINNYLYLNNGNLTFKNVTAQNNMATPSFSQGAAYGDMDGDGDMDIITNNINDNAFLYENNSEKISNNNFVNIVLKGTGKNIFAVGASVKIKVDDKEQLITNMPARSFLSSSEPMLHFGLGEINNISDAWVNWPDGKIQNINDLKLNKVNYIAYNPGGDFKKEEENKTAIFTEVTDKIKLNYTHKENAFIDFKREPLLPHKYSENGPGIAVGDVNGDGLDDVYFGGTPGAPGKFFIQQTNGNFSGATSGNIKPIAGTDDMGILLFDADNDGDNDLYIVGGGSEADSSSAYQDHLYLNDGKGRFVLGKNNLPDFSSSGSCIVSADFDGDGDLDLFRGGRIVPGRFPESPRSFLLRNDLGTFKDVTGQLAPDLLKPGLVCSALFTDYDNSGTPDLIVTGEWMPVMIFRNDKNKFVNVTEQAGLSQSNGWWNSVIAADFDHDGNMDYVLGNRGLNSRIRASKDKPACINYKDFDNNGSLDAIFCYYYPDGKSYPNVGRDEFIDQMRIMKKRLLRYADYAGKTLSEILTPEELSGVKVVNAYTFSSSFMHNDGKGKFILKDLPVEAQFAPVYGMVADDFDDDGNEDILLAGNFSGAEPNISKSDASTGLLLKGNGKGDFLAMSAKQSGFFVPGNARGLAFVYGEMNKNFKYLVANNNDKARVFELNNNSEKNKTAVKLNSLDIRITYQDNKGINHLRELYHGDGYLSSSSSFVLIPEGAGNIMIVDIKGKSRKVK